MTYLSTDNLSKNYGIKVLFEGLTFGLDKGDKTALVAQNGTGKSTLLRILAGLETPDEGEVMIRNGIRTGLLEQEPQLDDSLTIEEFISRGLSGMLQTVQAYEKAARDQARDFNPQTRKAFAQALAAMDTTGAWDYEQRMKQILTRLNIHDLGQLVATLSGGERKRVALAFVLLDEPDLLILDEPTNHLDVEMIEWLEAYLIQANIALLMVTHDRYFLDRVCNHILELDGGVLYHHRGNYSYYLQKRAERKEAGQSQRGKTRQLLKKELEWMRRAPKARTGKSKSRIDAFYEARKNVEDPEGEGHLRLKANLPRMGKQVLELKNVSKRFDERVILDGFSYSFNQGERIGIFGKNGTGKSTFLNILTGREPVDSGQIDTGETIVFGHYRQEGIRVDENMRVIDVIRDVAEVFELADGQKVTASRFLEHFMFPPKMQYTYASSLSGGEKRRLGLMMTLIKNPNFLILDEPTNDLDLFTLQKLEEFLLNFGGCLIVVSHDRCFMDKLVDHYFVFEGGGEVRDHHGTCDEYRQMAAREDTGRKNQQREAAGREPKQGGKRQPGQLPGTSSAKYGKGKSGGKIDRTSAGGDSPAGPGKGSGGGKGKPGGRGGAVSGSGAAGLSYREKKEYQNLEDEIARLEQQKVRLEQELSSGEFDYRELEEKSARYGEIEEKIDRMEGRWLELAERV